jgi:hypothetical protein
MAATIEGNPAYVVLGNGSCGKVNAVNLIFDKNLNRQQRLIFGHDHRREQPRVIFGASLAAFGAASLSTIVRVTVPFVVLHCFSNEKTAVRFDTGQTGRLIRAL